MGERARAIGNEAELKAWRFLQSLGYTIEETNNEQYDIDCLATFGNGNGAEPRLIRPRWSPEGLTAFEITEETVRRRKVTDFSAKIDRYNANNGDDPIRGGILLIDQNISPKMAAFMRGQGVWAWGRSRQRLYKEKLGTYNGWLEKYGNVSELPLDACCSYLRSSTPPPTTSDKLLHFSIYLDGDEVKLSMRKISEIMAQLNVLSIAPLFSIGISRVNIYLEFHSVGGLSATDEDFEREIVTLWKNQGVNISYPKRIFSDYRTFSSI